MNDICNVSYLCTILYEDDTSVLVNDKNLDKLHEILNDELNKLSTWLKANKLSLNVILDSKMSWVQHITYVKKQSL